MTGQRDLSSRIQNYLDGFASPKEAVEIGRILQSDPKARRLHDELLQSMMLLSTPIDVPVPDGLTARVMAAVQEQAPKRLRLPGHVERGFVVAGAAALAAIVIGAESFSSAGGLLGTASLSVAQLATSVQAFFLKFGNSITYFDWSVQLLASLSTAVRAVASSTNVTLLNLTLVSMFGMTAATIGLWQFEKRRREGGWQHANSLS